MRIGCVIMASGMARRFGSNKLLCDFDGVPMIQKILDSTGQIPFTARVVVTRHPEIDCICHAGHIPCVLHDLPLRSDTVRLGLQHLLQAHPDLDGCMFTPADQPCLTAESIGALCRAFEENPGLIYRLSHAGTPGSPVLFPRSVFDELLRLPEGKGGSAVIRAHPELVRPVEAGDARELVDVDTPETLQLLQSRKETP